MLPESWPEILDKMEKALESLLDDESPDSEAEKKKAPQAGGPGPKEARLLKRLDGNIAHLENVVEKADQTVRELDTEMAATIAEVQAWLERCRVAGQELAQARDSSIK